MIVDAHVHLFPPRVVTDRESYLERDAWFRQLYAAPKARIASAEDLLRSMDEAGVDRSVVAAFPWRDQTLCEQHNGHFRTLAGDERLRFLCTVQPRAGQRAVDELRRCLDAGFAGLGEMNVDAQGVELAEDDCWGPLVEVLVEAAGVLMLHSSEPVGHQYPGKGANTPEKIYRFALAHPELKLVAAHWGGGLPFYYLMPELGPSLPNLYFDSAATEFLYDSRVYERVIGAAGPERAMFGSDYPLLPQARALGHARSAVVAEDAPFYGSAAAAVYGL
ncbi:MAG TPA: amidohydrolase family protein [Chloroflexota bacterium]|nr:amidohydrolase family protein [Chloroflexota bacterium]